MGVLILEWAHRVSKCVKALSEGDIYIATRVITSNRHMAVLATKGLNKPSLKLLIDSYGRPR